jgi:hypothetical protein
MLDLGALTNPLMQKGEWGHRPAKGGCGTKSGISANKRLAPAFASLTPENLLRYASQVASLETLSAMCLSLGTVHIELPERCRRIVALAKRRERKKRI